jgi:hypothetical protein
MRRTEFRSESDFTRSWSAWLEAAGALVLPIVGSTMQPAGWPDRYVAHRSLPTGSLWVECKVDERQLTTAQRLTLRDLGERGVPAVELKLVRAAGTLLVKRHDGAELAATTLEALTGGWGRTEREAGHALLALLAGGVGQG